MNNFTQTFAIVLIVSVAFCSGSPARLERVRASKSRLLARQEVAPDAPTPTPYPAAGFQPELRFTLPTDEKLIKPDNTYLPPIGEPAKTYGPPARTYGPPDVSVNDEVEDVPLESEASNSEDPQIEGDQSNEVPEVVQSVAVSIDVPTAQSSGEEQPAEDVSEKDAEAEQIEEIIKEIEAEEDLIDSIPQRVVLAKTGKGKNASRLRPAKLQLAAPQRRQSLVAQPIYLVSRNGQLYKLLK